MRSFYYVVTDFKKNEVFSCGLKFKEFFDAIPEKPQNILLLKSQYGGSEYHSGIRMCFADQEHVHDLINDDIYRYGDFTWSDFENQAMLNEMKPEQIAELLYVEHMLKPMTSPWFPFLKNNFLYFAHDDDYWTKVFMKDVTLYKSVIHQKIIEGMKGRKREIKPMPLDILDYIFKNTEDGILFDFENISCANGNCCLMIYKLGAAYNYDSIFETFKRKENFTQTYAVIEYSGRKKTWSIFSHWK